MSNNSITLTETDYKRLNALVAQMENLEDLENEIERAKVISTDIPEDLVRMNSHFEYLNVTDNKVCEMTIVYPQDASSELRKISVTAPLGSALLGLRVGEEIDWTFPDGMKKKLRVLKIKQ